MSADRIAAAVARLLPDPATRVPATAEELREMSGAAQMTGELSVLYRLTGELGADDFELFEPALFVDVNLEREDFEELADLTFFAADYGSGFFACDPFDRIGLGEGAICYAQRGDMVADALVPCGDSLAVFLEHIVAGEQVWRGLPLGVRAEQRLIARLSDLPDGVEPGPPLDPMAFVTARERGLWVPMSLAALLERADGLWFGPNRHVFHFAEMYRLDDADAVVVGEDAALGTLAVTLGGWAGLPADRLFAFRPDQPPAEGRLLGRTADVIAMWIAEGSRR